MTFRGIDKQRFTFLLTLGTDELELRKFFTDCRVRLIQRGGKVQNLPPNDKARIRAIVHELPTNTDEVVRSWFAENLTMSDPESPESIVETFKLHEEVNEEIPESDAKRLARSCLVHLFSEQPPNVLLEFLRSPIGGAEPEEPEGRSEQAVAAPPNSGFQMDELTQLLLAFVQGQGLEKHLDAVTPDFATFVLALQAASRGRLKEAREALEGLPGESVDRSRLEQFIKQLEARPTREPPRGVTVEPLEPFGGGFDYETDEVVGYCTNSASPNAVFVQPMALLRSGKPYRVNSEIRRKLFPANGDVMAFPPIPGAKYPRQPRRGEVGVWRVEEHETDKATHFHLRNETRPVYELFAVPFPSEDYESVREFILERVEEKGTSQLQQPLFVLSDGLIVGARPDRTDLSKEESFEAGLLSWNEMSILRLEGRMFVLGPLPREHGVYDCASLEIVVRKLLRPNISGTKRLNLTKSQISDLVEYFESHEADLTASRLERIRAEFGLLEQNNEASEALVQELLGHPQIKQRVDALVRDAAERILQEKTEIQADIVRLRKERDEWEQRVQKQKDEHKRLRDETTRIVRAAFEKARTESIGTLAELAVFQELTGTKSEDAGSAVFRPAVREFNRSEKLAHTVLQEAGVSARRARAFSAFGELIRRAGLIVAVRGMAARLVVERWAASVGKGILVDATVGLVDDTPLKQYLNGAERPEVVAVLDANLSALDIYARPISDATVAALLENERKATTAILFSMTDSVGHLPVPQSLQRVLITVDLDFEYAFDTENTDEMLAKAFDPEDGVLTKRLWRPAVNRLQECVNALDSDTKVLVLPLLLSETRTQ